ncbi:MAG: nucleotidyltransferase domain-containing protein [Nitrospiria bacterium]
MTPRKKKNLRIKRETADRILKELVEAAGKINSSPKTQFMYFVSKLVVFGSYLTLKEKLGDIDVAIEIEPRWKTEEEYNRWLPEVCEKKQLGLARIYYPYQKILSTLRNRSKSLSFHPMFEIVQQKYPHKIIYERDFYPGLEYTNSASLKK